MDEGLHLLARIGIAPATIVDVGASDGRWARSAHSAFRAADLVLFEPQPAHVPALERFQLENPKAKIIRSAVGRAGGSSWFDAADPFGGILLEQKTSDSIAVSVTTLDEALAAAKPPFLVKLDTHGAESAILEGARETLTRSVAWVIEAYNQRFSGECMLFWELCCFMGEHGFRPIDILDVSRRPYDGTLWQMDVCFVRADWPGFGYIGYR